MNHPLSIQSIFVYQIINQITIMKYLSIFHINDKGNNANVHCFSQYYCIVGMVSGLFMFIGFH